jgi:hypothetical protein
VPGDEVPHAVDDARAVAAVLRARGYVVTTVDDRRGSAAPPTRAGVLTTVRQVAAACTADDVLVLYACCHGVRARGRPWLLLADSQYTDDGRVVGGLALSDLLDALRRRARRVAVFLEACQIGLGLDPGIGRALRHCGARGGSFALLAGSTTGSQSLDGSDGAVFTRCLRDGLSGGAADPDGAMRMSALARYVQAGVAAWNRSPEGELVDSSQRPILRPRAGRPDPGAGDRSRRARSDAGRGDHPRHLERVGAPRRDRGRRRHRRRLRSAGRFVGVGRAPGRGGKRARGLDRRRRGQRRG